MKQLALSLVMLASASAMAVDHPGHLKAEGHAFYKEGKKIEKKLVNLFVPKMGKGKVILEVGGKEAESHGFKTVDVNGRKVFYVVFTDLKGITGAPKDTAYLLRGTYMRGDNVAVYYGDFFSKKMTPKAKLTWDVDADSEEAVASVDACDDTCSGDCGDDCGCEDCKCEEGGTCDPKGPKKTAAVDPTHHKGGGHHHGRPGHRHGGWTYAGGFGFHSKITK
jgi:hypothetical protein